MVERVPPHERGAALLTVLLLVAVMSVVAAGAMERLTLATKLAGNAAALDQARAYALASEPVVAARLGDLVSADRNRTSLAGGWNGTWQALPVPGGSGFARATDGGNCFNLNSTASGESVEGLSVRPQGVTQFRTLMELLGVAPAAAVSIANATADWIDADGSPQPNGAEDEIYARAAVPYRAANTRMVDPSELRAVAGVTPAIYATIRPWVCALPVTDLSPINVNTILPEQAPLIAMLMGGQTSVAQARALIEQRPAGGFATNTQFWALPALTGQSANLEAMTQTSVRTRWFAVEARVSLAGAEARETALFDARDLPVRLVRRQWGEAQ